MAQYLVFIYRPFMLKKKGNVGTVKSQISTMLIGYRNWFLK
jgi:hypothetical protein